MLLEEAVERMYAKGKSFYEVVRDFVDSPPQGFNVVFDPSTMEEGRSTDTHDRLVRAVVVGLTAGDNWETRIAQMDYTNGKNTREELGILLRVRADQGLIAVSGIDARFFYPECPTELLEPMKSLSLLPSGWFDDVFSPGRQRYNRMRREENAVAIVGIAANAITENRLIAPDVYWIQKITGNTFPSGVSPFPPNR